jgi:glycosyltransferase involved in cell wall biosynthesis
MKALVVCPTYGRIPYLGRMLASFLIQNYKDKHLVIVNDDPNVTLRCKCDNVTTINVGKKITVGEKRNIGIAAKNDFDVIFPFDDDDVFLPNRIPNNISKINAGANAYRNKICYVTYDNEFLISGSPPNCISYLKKVWLKIGCYPSLTDGSDDLIIHDKMLNMNDLVLDDNDDIDFIYSFSGVNYHLSSGQKMEYIEKVAYNQLVKLDLLEKEYWIEPDFKKYGMMMNMVNYHKSIKKPFNIKHVGDAELIIDN